MLNQAANKYMGYSKVRRRPAPRERADSSTRIPQLGPLYYVQALRDVAVALGHNRLDVLSHYIWVILAQIFESEQTIA